MDGISPAGRDGAAVTEVRRRLAPYVRTTPILGIRAGDLGCEGAPLFLKLEHMQHAATFKARAAVATIIAAREERGGRLGCVAAASRGNWGVAVAWAAARLGLRARIFLPDGVPQAKIARIRGYGAEIALAGRRRGALIDAERAWADRAGAALLRADAPAALAAYASLSAEIGEAVAVDTLLVPVGSGALAAGLASAARPGQRVVGVEPQRCATLHAAIAAGCPVEIGPSGIAADTLGSPRVGDAVFRIARAHIAGVALVSDLALVEARKTLWSEARIAVELGAAAGLAALQTRAYEAASGERIGILLTGGNG